MNLIQVAGRLGSDPETRFTSSGQKVSSFRIASNARKSGQDVTIWWRVTVWGDRFDKIMSYLKKGSAIMVAGPLQPPSVYQDREGNWQPSLDITAEIINFSPFGGKQDSNFNSDSAGSVEEGKGEPSSNNSVSKNIDDDLPF